MLRLLSLQQGLSLQQAQQRRPFWRRWQQAWTFRAADCTEKELLQRCDAQRAFVIAIEQAARPQESRKRAAIRS